MILFLELNICDAQWWRRRRRRFVEVESSSSDATTDVVSAWRRVSIIADRQRAFFLYTAETQQLRCFQPGHIVIPFLLRDAMQARPMLSCGVRLSGCLSRSCILSKRINKSSNFFHHRVATPF